MSLTRSSPEYVKRNLAECYVGLLNIHMSGKIEAVLWHCSIAETFFTGLRISLHRESDGAMI